MNQYIHSGSHRLLGPKGCCGPFWATSATVLFLIALALPWYVEISSYHDLYIRNPRAEVLDLLTPSALEMNFSFSRHRAMNENSTSAAFDDTSSTLSLSMLDLISSNFGSSSATRAARFTTTNTGLDYTPDVTTAPGVKSSSHTVDLHASSRAFFTTVVHLLTGKVTDATSYFSPAIATPSEHEPHLNNQSGYVDYSSTKVDFRGWEDAYCGIDLRDRSNASYRLPIPTHHCNHGAKYYWREACPDEDCVSLTNTYSLTSFFSASALVLAAIAMIFSLHRCCGNSKPGYSWHLIITYCLCNGAAILALGVFAISHTDGMFLSDSLQAERCIASDGTSYGPCYSFLGGFSTWIIVNDLLEYRIAGVWSPVGFFVTIAALFCGFLAFLLSLQPIPDRSWANVHYSDLIEPIQPQGMMHNVNLPSINGGSGQNQYSNHAYDMVEQYSAYDAYATTYTTPGGAYYTSPTFNGYTNGGNNGNNGNYGNSRNHQHTTHV